MKTKKIISIVLSIFVVLCVVAIAFKEIKKSQNNAQTTSPRIVVKNDNANEVKKDDHLVVYYFHGNMRCTTCKMIEQYTKEALDNFFPNELKTKAIVFKAVNVELQGNEHFVKDYDLTTRSVVLVKYNADKKLKWENLKEVWSLVRSKPDFMNYIQKEVKTLDK